MNSRPWANAVPRLLRERSLKGIDLVTHGGLTRQGTISAVVNSPKTPLLQTLLNIAHAIETADAHLNKKNSKGRVEMWEFFVSDEQASLLRTLDAQKASLIKPPETSDEQQFMERMRRYLAWEQEHGDEPVRKPHVVPHHKVK